MYQTQRIADQNSVQPQSFVAGILLCALVALFLFVADTIALQVHSGTYRVEIGNFRDEYFLDGAHFQEVALDGTPYRWTRPESRLTLNQIGVGADTILTLKLGGRPVPAQVQMALRDTPWFTFTAEVQPRKLKLLLPHADERAWIDITSEAYRAPNDSRRVGIKLEQLTIQNTHVGIPFPPLGQYLAQLALILAIQGIVWRLGWRLPAQAAVMGSVALGLAFLLSVELLFTMQFVPRLVAAGVLLVLLTWYALPLLARWACHPVTGFVSWRELCVLWALALGAVAIRLVGVLYPSFGGQDLGRNLGRLSLTVLGQLYIIAPSSEFAKGLTIYPTGPYLALMPGMLATNDLPALMQGGLALMDSFTALLTGLLALRLGGGKHAARVAVALYGVNIAAFGAMTFSFSAQIFGQWFTAPLALVLLGSTAPASRRTWVIAMFLMSFAVFSHIGVAFLALGWMGLLLLFSMIAYRRIPWWGWGLFAGACVAAFTFLYVEIVRQTLNHAAATVVPASVGSGTLLKGYSILLVNGLRLGYSDIGLLLFPLGLILMVPLVQGSVTPTWFQSRVVPLAWFGTAVFFLLVELLLNVQVRYIYFALPLILALIALPLGRIAARGNYGRVLVWSLTLAVMVPQALLWLAATWGEGRIPMTPLTH